ncbi:MAG TPA: replicative DNA helicase [Alphaproteobacteria bacterium]|nr:replicative DNA helicase [Alphaproteobacteria bacterium]
MADIIQIKAPASAGATALTTDVATALPVLSHPVLEAAPHSVPAEQALLGAILVNNRLLDDLGGSLLAEHFYVPLNAAVFEAAERIINKGREANPITIRENLRGTAYDDDTIFPHLSQMFEQAGLGSEVKSLAEVIHTTYLQRQLMALSQGLGRQAAGAHRQEDVAQVMDAISGELFRLAETGQGSTTVRGLREPLKEVILRAEQARAEGSGIVGVSSGFVDVDALLGGLQKSDLIILAARPSMGKTALALNIAQKAAERKFRGEPNGAAVGVFSLEMSAEQLAARMLSGTARIPSNRLTTGHLNRDEYDTLVSRSGELAELPLYIDDTPQLSINSLRSRARRMKRQYGIGMIIVDYLQLMTAPAKAGGDNRVQEVSEISMGLKTVARELNVPVIALSQLSRAVESRDNKRPQLSDLRESGSIEQDADVVLFLYREEYYLARQLGADDSQDEKTMKMKERLDQTKGKAELLVSKNRKGGTGVAELIFDAEVTTFFNAVKHYRSPAPSGESPF